VTAIRYGVVLILLGLMCPSRPLLAGEDRPSTSAATDARIAELIRDLGDASYEKRVFATRRLCAIGVKARDMLLTAAGSDDAETALRAKQVLNALDSLWFAGTDVSLAFSRTKTAWDEPVDLRIAIANNSKYPTRLPFEIDRGKRSATSADALQVGDMLDVADWLKVRHRDGREIELRVDDISADAAVTAAVQLRLNGEPISTLDPGVRISVTARAFNRGWARYPLLDAGEYVVVLDYVPEWQDEALAAERVGRVVSNKATITVTTGAAESVSRGGAVASLTLTREGAELVSRLVNRTDQVMVLNKNFAASPPFAQGRWVYTLGDSIHELPIASKLTASWHDFDQARLVRVHPGHTIELARIKIAELHNSLIQAGADLSGDRWAVHFSYSNTCDRQWQSRQGSALLGNEDAPTIFRKPLPRLILSTRHASNALTAPRTR